MLRGIHSDRAGVARMEALARDFGISPERAKQIIDAVEKEALTSGREVDVEQMLEDVRNRIHLARP